MNAPTWADFVFHSRISIAVGYCIYQKKTKPELNC